MAASIPVKSSFSLKCFLLGVKKRNNLYLRLAAADSALLKGRSALSEVLKSLDKRGQEQELE